MRMCDACEVRPAVVRCGKVRLCADCATDPSARAVELIGGQR